MIPFQEQDQSQTAHGSDDGRKQDDHGQRCPPQPGAQHGQELEIPKPHAFLARQPLEQPVHQPQAAIAETGAQNAGIAVDKHGQDAGEQPQPEHGQRDYIGQQLAVEIDHAQREQAPGQQQRGQHGQGGSELPGDHDGQHRREHFDQGVAEGDPCLASRAASAQGDIAHERNVLQQRERPGALRAMRTGNRQVERWGRLRALCCLKLQKLTTFPPPLGFHHDGQAVHHHVQEAADHQAEQAHQDQKQL